MRRFIQIVENAHLREFTEEDLAHEPEWTPERGINDYVVWVFTGGCCNHMAAALHDVTGWPIYGSLENGAAGHFWVVNPQGKAVDINGVWPGAVAHAYGSEGGEVAEVTRESLNSNEGSTDSFCDIPPYCWARLLIKDFPSHFGL